MTSTLLVVDMSVPPYNQVDTFVSGAVVPLGSNLLVVADDLVASGTTQDTAPRLTGQTNIIRSGVTGGGLQLPTIIKGSIIAINEWTQDVVIWPPDGAHLNELQVDQGVIISAHGKVEFYTANGSVKWVAR